MTMFHDIAVIGLGLLGGSLCKCARRNIPGSRMTAYGRDLSKLAPALDDGAVDEIGLVDRMQLSGKDLVVVCTPVIRSVEIIRAVLQRHDLAGDAVVIDVGSVKQGVIDGVADLQRAGSFVGCHPMAGSEQTGYSHSDADLYRDASVIITPSPANDESVIRRVDEFWRKLGAKTSRVDPADHDFRVSLTSHVPHIAACLLVRLLASGAADGEIDHMLPFIGNGFRDMTRIASGSPDMWSDIVLMNRENIARALAGFAGEFDKFRQRYLDSGNASADRLAEFFSGVKSLKNGIQ